MTSSGGYIFNTDPDDSSLVQLEISNTKQHNVIQGQQHHLFKRVQTKIHQQQPNNQIDYQPELVAEMTSKDFLKTQNYTRKEQINACQYLEPIEDQKQQTNFDDNARIAVQVKMVQEAV